MQAKFKAGARLIFLVLLQSSVWIAPSASALAEVFCNTQGRCCSSFEFCVIPHDTGDPRYAHFHVEGGDDHFNIRVGAKQWEVKSGELTFTPRLPSGPTKVSVQGCAGNGFFGKSVCSPWDIFTVATVSPPPPAAPKAPALMEWNTDRPGGDYHSMDLGKGMTHDTCRDICIKDGRCLAYTYVKAGVQGPNPRCWLKSSIPAARSSDCCISGVVRTAAVQPKPQPAPTSPPQSKSLVGVWDSQTGDGQTYTLIVERQGGRVSAYVGSADAKLDGTLQATLSADGKQMAFVLTQPKIGVTSRGQISLAGNGDSFEGRITKDTDGISRSWTGIRRN